jgi:hypothetical protein
MEESGMSVIFDEDRLKVLYEKGVQPAFEDALREYHNVEGTAGQELYLPPSRELAAAHGRGHHQFTVRQLPVAIIQRFGISLLANLADEPGFKGALFHHEIMGVKMAHCHNPEDPVQRWDQLYGNEGILAIFDPQLLPRAQQARDEDVEGIWYCDVGIEFSSENHVIHWQRGGHSKALSLSFPTAHEIELSRIIEEHSARTVLDTRDAYRLDAASSLYQVAGFFFNALHPRASSHIGEADPISAIAYCTDKTLFIKRGSESTGPFSTPSCSSVASKDKFDQKIMSHVFNAIKLLIEAGRLSSSEDDDLSSLDRTPPRQLGAARLEVRINVHQAHDVLVAVPPEFRGDCLYSWDPQTWW